MDWFYIPSRESPHQHGKALNSFTCFSSSENLLETVFFVFVGLHSFYSFIGHFSVV